MAMASNHRCQRVGLFLVVLTLVSMLFWRFKEESPISFLHRGAYQHIRLNTKHPEDVVLIIKTGATEAFRTMPIHFITTITHTPNFLLFSDAEQHIGKYLLRDSLIRYSREDKEESKDFRLYREVQEFLELGQDPSHLEGGWELDKFKNLQMLKMSWELRPDAKWYVFIDADSYIFWANLLRWLGELDHEKPMYIGSPAYLSDQEFAHGGTGYIISQGAVQQTLGRDPDIPSKYTEDIRGSCCGDHILGRAMADHGVKLTKSWPRMNGEPPYSIEFREDQWCSPIMTCHHMSAVEIQEMWNFERVNATKDKYIRYEDLYQHFVHPHLRPSRENWDNLSGDPLGHDVDSFDACREACADKDDCMQYKFERNKCWLDSSISLGQKAILDGDQRSGWNLERIQTFRERMSPCRQITG